MQKKINFVNDGYFKFSSLSIEKKCKDLNDSILRNKKIDKKIFLSKKNYKKTKEKKYKKKDILNKFKINFLLNNSKFKKLLIEILGKNYKLYAQRVICSIPKSIFPKWIKKELREDVPNLTKFIKPEYRYMRYLIGADFHNDFIDFEVNDKANFITVYVYLSKVTKSMSPLILLPKTHLAGYDKYPHKIVNFKNKISYFPKNKKKINTRKISLIGKEGDTWGWHAHLIHGTRPAYSKTPRLSLRLIFRQVRSSNFSQISIVNNRINKTSKF
jgi:hypothetical protein